MTALKKNIIYIHLNYFIFWPRAKNSTALFEGPDLMAMIVVRFQVDDW